MPDDAATGQIEQYLDELDGYAKKNGYDSAHLVFIADQPDQTVQPGRWHQLRERLGPVDDHPERECPGEP